MITRQHFLTVILLSLVYGAIIFQQSGVFGVCLDVGRSPDGIRIAFGSNRKGPYDLYVRPSSGARAEEPLLETPNTKFPQDWSRDGRFLLYTRTGKFGC